MPTTRVNHVDLVYEIADYRAAWAPERPAVLLLHGLNSSRRHWFNQLPRFSTTHRVVAWDLRGHGESGKPPAGYRVVDFAADALALMDALEIDRAHVVAASAAGLVGLHLAATEPERVTSLTLVGSSSHTLPDVDPDAIERGVRALGVEGFFRTFVRQQTFAPAPDEQLVELVMRIIAQDPPEILLQRLREISDYDARAELSRIRCPTLIVTGECDGTTPPAISESMRTSIPASQLCVLPNVGHLPHLEAPDIFNPILARFLAEVDDQDRVHGNRKESAA
jgi:3-oxoadipate enol-lactonase